MAKASPVVNTLEFSEVIHATTVAVGGIGILIVGPSGSGKSALALQLIALGAVLVSDDQTCIRLVGEELRASAPVSILGQIEARGVGILKVATLDTVVLGFVVDMGKVSNERLPKSQSFDIGGLQLPCFHRIEGPHLASTILLLAKGAYLNPDDKL